MHIGGQLHSCFAGIRTQMHPIHSQQQIVMAWCHNSTRHWSHHASGAAAAPAAAGVAAAAAAAAATPLLLVVALGAG